jgi:hypothetical protein
VLIWSGQVLDLSLPFLRALSQVFEFEARARTFPLTGMRHFSVGGRRLLTRKIVSAVCNLACETSREKIESR